MTRASGSVERLTKAIVLVSLAGGFAFEMGHAPPRLVLVALAACPVLLYAGRRWREWAAGVVLAAGCLMPAVARMVITRPPEMLSWWSLALFVVILAGSGLRWHVPPLLRFPFIVWGLSIALSAPIVVLREFDLLAAWLWHPLSGSPVRATPDALWVVSVARVHMLGLIWIDWLWRHFQGHDPVERFVRRIVVPSMVAAILSAPIACFQGFVDLHFLWVGRWPSLGRASGTLLDANASGVLYALWIALPVGFATMAVRRRWAVLLVVGSILLLAATWATASRTGLFVAVAGLAGLVHLAAVRPALRRPAVVALAFLLVLGAAAAVVARPSAVVTPLQRARELVPDFSMASLQSAARELWVRNGYGTGSVAMIKATPWQGVGVGAFHMLIGDYAGLPRDNAQNWFRHQLAELGILGSIGWIWWTAVLAFALTRKGRFDAHDTRLLLLKYTLAGFGITSLVGMPGQNVYVAIAVLTFAFWLLITRDVFSAPTVLPAAERSRRAAIVALVVALVFAAATAYAGAHALRPPIRAWRVNGQYQYGFTAPVDGPSGQVQSTAHGMALPLAATSKVRLTVWVEHPDAGRQPVLVELRVDQRRVVRGRFSSDAPIVRVEPVEAGRRFALEALVDRTFTPPDTPGREVGVNLRWEYLAE
jgi:hypothetical protein